MKGIEDQIRQAIEEGKFDDLPGAGKPLPLQENPHENPEWRAAYRILRSSGFTLPWIESRKEIEVQYAAAHRSLSRTWEWRTEALDAGRLHAEVNEVWMQAARDFQEQIASVNEKIKSYNIEAPSTAFHLPPFDAQIEIDRVTGG